jgi:hypothetical protein
MVGQVKIVGILMLVHGITVILFGGLRIVLDAMTLATAPPPAAGPGGGFDPVIFVVISIAWGVLIALLGVLNAIAGFRVMYFRNRVLGLVALFTNLIVLLTCCCAFTAIGMMIYGLIVLFQSDVSHAFDMVARGYTPEEAIGRFTRRYYDVRDDYDEMNEPRREWDDDRDSRRENWDDRSDDEYDRDEPRS